MPEKNCKKILVTAGGTATAWHLVNIVQEFYRNSIEIYVCDTNAREVVPSAQLADGFFQVPLADNQHYESVLSNVIRDNQIDVIIPLIPYEAMILHPEAEIIKSSGIKTAAPKLETTEALADKVNLCTTLEGLGIPTPHVFVKKEIENTARYIMKPRLGFGSLGIEVVSGEEILNGSWDFDKWAVQEYCHDDDYDEITVEVFNFKNCLQIFSRRRIATKAGVCVKMEPVDNEIFFPYIKKLTTAIDCPVAFNVQFLFHKQEWKLFDCNLRLGAGTALSSAIGFQLSRAMLAALSGMAVDEKWFHVDPAVKKVLRVYQELVVR